MGSVAVFTGLVQQPVKQGNVMGVCLLRRILLSMHSKLIYRTSTIPVPAQSLISVSKSKTTAALKSPSTSILPATSLNLADSAPTTPPSKLTGRLPALGWNSWNAYRCNINETKILAAANQIVSLGLKDVGYEYVNIDDCWASMMRDSTTGRMVPDLNKFPSGIASLATKIHALGLKSGIYSDAGTATCAGYPGSLGTEALDAATFNDWGIDYLKYDNCNVPANWTDVYLLINTEAARWKLLVGIARFSLVKISYKPSNSNTAIRYRQMGAELAAQPRPIQFEICDWGAANVWEWGAKVGHSWRMSGDSGPTWSYITSIININVAHISATTFYAHNDMDMMEIGNGALTIQEQRTHFAAWAFLKSPILLGTDVSYTSFLSIIKNAELLAFHQDTTIGTAATPFEATTTTPTTTPPEYYSGASSKGIHVFIINTSSGAATKTFTLSNVPGIGTGGTWKFHDMWTGTDLSGTYAATANFSVNVAAHDTVAYLLTMMD
ncbi:putative alpha-galactosidase B [Termitomyces sp. J132]|nr:putative alpha-galactosidase B [Termitomyces sp. J132]